MPNQRARQLMIENFQDSLRLVRHLMDFGVEEFAEAIGVTRQTVNNLETKKSKLSVTQYIAIAALTDSYFAQNGERLTALKAILDGDGKNYGEDYETAFRDDSLLKRWFEDIVYFDEEADDATEAVSDELKALTRDYKIILDATTLTADDAPDFVKALTAALTDAQERIIVPLRSIEEIDAADGAKYYRAKKLLSQMQDAGVLQIHGEASDPDFHDTVLSVFERFRDTYRLCLITPNESLAQEVLQLNDADEEDFDVAAGFVEEGAFKFYERLESTCITTKDFEDWAEL